MKQIANRWTVTLLSVALTATACTMQSEPDPEDLAKMEQSMIGDCSVFSVTVPTGTIYAPGDANISAAGSCDAGQAYYKFFVRYPDGSWQLPCGGYDTATSCYVTGLAAGTYRAQVWVRNDTNYYYEGYRSSALFDVSPPLAWAPCTDASIDVTPPDYLWEGDMVTISGSANCGEGEPLVRSLYRTAAEPFTDDKTVNGVWDPAEDFTDTNENGVWDPAEDFTDTNENGVWDPAEWLDDVNENGIWDEGEDFTDTNGNGVWDPAEWLDDVNGNGVWDPAEWLDDVNGNGVWDPAEDYIDRIDNDTYDVAGNWMQACGFSKSDCVWEAVAVPGEYVNFRVEIQGGFPEDPPLFSDPTGDYWIRTGTPAVCTATSLVRSPISANTGYEITLTATADCTQNADAQYSFFVRLPNGTWTKPCPWQYEATCLYTPEIAGTYDAQVWIRRHGSSSTAAESSKGTGPFTVTDGEDCTGVDTTPYPADYALVGDVVTWTHTPTCPPAMTPTYRTSWRMFPDDPWTTICDWTSSNLCNWDTSELLVGPYEIRVEALGYAFGTSVETTLPYIVNPNDGFTCTITDGPTATPDPGIVGTPFLLTTSTACGELVRPEYTYYVRDPGGVWTQACPWSPNNECAWTPLAEGTYSIQVWVRRQGSSTLDAYRSNSYTVIVP